MKKLILIFLPSFIVFSTAAQTAEEPMDVKIKTPRMSVLIDKLWVDLPTDCNVPSSATVDQGDESCAGLAMKHFRAIINTCTMSDGFKEAIKTEFKIIKLIPVGKAVGVMLDIADLTVKALSANSPEALEADLVKFGFGKVVGDEIVGKMKKLLPEDIGTDILGNLTKFYYKKLWDKAKAAIMPSEQSYECHPEGEACKDNIHMTIVPYTGDDPKILATFVFSANGDCACKLKCSPGTPAPLLKTWEVHGEMQLMIDKAEVVDQRSWLLFTKKVLEVTLVAGRPTYHVQADCGCSESNTSNISYDGDKQDNNLFVGGGLINEDAGERFNLFGANVAYTHNLSQKIGVTGDAGVYFGKQFMVDYRKIQVLAGPSFFTGNNTSKVVFTPHALVGVVNTHSAYGSGNNSSSSSNTGLAAAVGTDIMLKIGKGKGAGIRVDFNPIFPKGGVVKNFRLAAGVVL